MKLEFAPNGVVNEVDWESWGLKFNSQWRQVGDFFSFVQAFIDKVTRYLCLWEVLGMQADRDTTVVNLFFYDKAWILQVYRKNLGFSLMNLFSL